MQSTNRFQALTWRAAAAVLAALSVTACGVDKQEAPALTGPSGFAMSLIVSAAPQILARDGSSMSTITVTARNADGSPSAGRRLLFSASSGTLLTNEVLTNNDGRAAVVYVAPSQNVAASAAEISVTPVEAGDRANTHGTSLIVELRGPDVPIADFTFDPDDAVVLDLVSFDASTSTLGGNPCLAGCSYSWDFGDGATATGLGVSHAFNSAGVFNVTLTVTSLASGTTASTTRPVRIAVPPAPQAVLSINPTSPTAGQAITFSSVSVIPPGVSIVRHVWDLDNGAPPIDTGSTSSYVLAGGYAAATTHRVTLTITDNYGRTVRSEPRTVTIP
jgi:PKD repeat protein